MFRQVADRHRSISDAQWTEILKRSIREPVIDGVAFPAFPPEQIQANFVGSSNEVALHEAHEFYTFFKERALTLSNPVDRSSVFLDFGCGWGRFLRFFWRDVDAEKLCGVDTDPTVLDLCRQLGVEAILNHIEPLGRLPFPDRTFTHIMAYSVLTHLPEQVQFHWLDELARVSQPGCVFICTTEPRRFLHFVESIPQDAPSPWHEAIKRCAGDVAALKKKFDEGEFVYIPTGGGEYRDESVYGEAVIPPSYINEHWSKHFYVDDYLDDAQRFWQAVVVYQRR